MHIHVVLERVKFILEPEVESVSYVLLRMPFETICHRIGNGFGRLCRIGYHSKSYASHHLEGRGRVREVEPRR
jgi:hypothetical protein